MFEFKNRSEMIILIRQYFFFFNKHWPVHSRTHSALSPLTLSFGVNVVVIKFGGLYRYPWALWRPEILVTRQESVRTRLSPTRKTRYSQRSRIWPVLTRRRRSIRLKWIPVTRTSSLRLTGVSPLPRVTIATWRWLRRPNWTRFGKRSFSRGSEVGWILEHRREE